MTEAFDESVCTYGIVRVWDKDGGVLHQKTSAGCSKGGIQMCIAWRSIVSGNWSRDTISARVEYYVQQCLQGLFLKKK